MFVFFQMFCGVLAAISFVGFLYSTRHLKKVYAKHQKNEEELRIVRWDKSMEIISMHSQAKRTLLRNSVCFLYWVRGSHQTIFSRSRSLSLNEIRHSHRKRKTSEKKITFWHLYYPLHLVVVLSCDLMSSQTQSQLWQILRLRSHMPFFAPFLSAEHLIFFTYFYVLCEQHIQSIFKQCDKRVNQALLIFV